ncbi:MAG: SAM-dependent methyltransferase, partial [Hydrogenoanaerobacterium sp.]
MGRMYRKYGKGGAKMKLYIVGIGPGGADEITPHAAKAIAKSDVIAGYTVYIELLAGQT